MPLVYLANGLGFSGLTSPVVANIVQQVERAGFSVFEPFVASKDLGAEMGRIIASEKDVESLKKKLRAINAEIGRRNVAAIEKADVVIALLDGGLDIDSGVASEIGFAAGRNKRIIGLRTDIRSAGDNPGSAVNLQVEHFIITSGGTVVSDIGGVLEFLS